MKIKNNKIGQLEKIRKRGIVLGSKLFSLAEALAITGIYCQNKIWNVNPYEIPRKIKKGDKLKVAVVSEYYYPTLGGVTEHVHNFSLNMLKQGHDVRIITSNAGEINRDIGPLKDKIIRIGHSVPIYSNDSYARITLGTDIGEKMNNIFKTEKFDIVHVHSPITPTLPILAIKYSTVPVVGTFHTDFDSSFWMSFFRDKLIRFMDKMSKNIAVSPVGSKSMEKFYGNDYSYAVIPNGVNTDFFNPNVEPVSQINDDYFNILYVGRFDPRNGLGILIDAFDKIARKYSKTRLIIVGYGPLEYYYQKRVADDLKDRVVFVGKIDEERPAYYNACDIMCVPAKKGSFGITLIEGMACGLPLITSDIEGFRYVMTNGKEGIMLKDLENRDEFAKAIEALIVNPQLQLHMSYNARLRAMDFSWEKITKEVVEQYYEVLKAEDNPDLVDSDEKDSISINNDLLDTQNKHILA